MHKSIPNISSLGNANPQSTTIILSSHSMAVIFIPICSNPPRGIILTFVLWFCFLFCCLNRIPPILFSITFEYYLRLFFNLHSLQYPYSFTSWSVTANPRFSINSCSKASNKSSSREITVLHPIQIA